MMVLGLLAGYNVYLVQSSENVMDLALMDLEARAADGPIEDWWNRPDYDCVTIKCYTIFGTYERSVAQYMGEGQGSEAHTWCCTGCD